MHVAQLEAPVARVSQKVRPQRSRRREVHPVSPRRHVMISKQRPAAEFKIGYDPSPRGEVPLQVQRIETDSVSGVGRLEHQKSRYGIKRVLESSLEKSRAVRPG